MSYPDEVKFTEANHLVLELVNHYRYLQPAPSPLNAAKALLVYRTLDDGVAKKTSNQVAYPGSPVQLSPGYSYIVRSDIGLALTEPEKAVADSTAASRLPIMVLISDEYRPAYGAENHFSFTVSDPARLPSILGATTVCARFPNPGAKRVGFWFRTAGAGGTVLAEVKAQGIPYIACSQTVIGPGHAELVHVVGVSEALPVEWEVLLTAPVALPTSVDFFVSFNEEA